MKKFLMVLLLLTGSCSWIEEQQQMASNFSITPLDEAWNYRLKRDGFYTSNYRMHMYFYFDSLKGDYDRKLCTDSSMLENKLILKMRGTGNTDKDYIFFIKEAYVVRNGMKQRMFIELPPNSTGKEKVRNLENKLFKYEYGLGCDKIDGAEFIIGGLYDEDEKPLMPIHFRVNYAPQKNPQRSELWKFAK